MIPVVTKPGERLVRGDGIERLLWGVRRVEERGKTFPAPAHEILRPFA